jgi:uncharacterized protein YoxC
MIPFSEDVKYMYITLKGKVAVLQPVVKYFKYLSEAQDYIYDNMRSIINLAQNRVRKSSDNI